MTDGLQAAWSNLGLVSDGKRQRHISLAGTLDFVKV